MATDDTELFGELRGTMPELLDEMGSVLAEHPTVRDVITMPKTGMLHNWPTEHIRIDGDKHPEVAEKLGILLDHGLISRHESEYAYRIMPKLAAYLRKGS